MCLIFKFIIQICGWSLLFYFPSHSSKLILIDAEKLDMSPELVNEYHLPYSFLTIVKKAATSNLPHQNIHFSESITSRSHGHNNDIWSSMHICSWETPRKMKVYAIFFITCESAAIAIVVLCCLCKGGRQKKRPTVGRSVAPPSAWGMEGQNSKNSGSKYGGMVILVGESTAIATTAVVTASSGEDGGGGFGDDGGGCGVWELLFCRPVARERSSILQWWKIWVVNKL